MKIASVVGARPNFIKLAPVYKSTKNISEHTIIHTGQHYDYGMSGIFFKELKLPTPDFNLGVGSATATLQISDMLRKLDSIFKEIKFDVVLVYGDTNSTLAGAMAAAKSGLAIAHVESGLRSFDRKMPEEFNRVLTDNISHLLFAPTKTAIDNLQAEKIPAKIYNTGDIAVEIVRQAADASSNSTILSELGLKSKSYILFTMHRAENTASIDKIKSMIEVFERLSDFQFVFPVHPRTRKVLESMNLQKHLERCRNVRIIDPVGYIDFIRLMHDSIKVITDSGGAQKEAYILSIPCITIRPNTEWVETVKAGWNIITDTDIDKIISNTVRWWPRVKQESIFGDGKTSEIIKDILLDSVVKK